MSASRRAGSRRRRAIRRRRLVACAVLVAAAGGVAILILGAGDGSRPARAHRFAQHEPAPGAPAQQRRAVAAALERVVQRAHALGGAVEAAALFGSWGEPVVSASESGGASRWMRMWSMSKVVTVVALLRAMGWGDAPGTSLSPEVERALQGALRRSENCPQRRLVLELQDATGGSTDGARRAFAEVLRAAGSEARVSKEAAVPDPSCVEYLEGQREIPEPLAPTVLFGTSTWRVADAARFVAALGSGVYGRAVTSLVLKEMRAPKGHSREALPSEFTAPLDWGAGSSFADHNPAYKAGWGGTQQGAFLAGQIVLLRLPDDGSAGLAVMFHPDLQPVRDDPGLTAAPSALELVMDQFEQQLP